MSGTGVTGLAVAVLGGLLLAWLALLLVLRLAAGDQARLQDALRLLPDLVRLVHRLARDSSLPTGVRVRLFALIAYLAFPVDLVPDFLPVVGYADDVVLVAVVLRSVVRRAGVDAVRRHWSGSDEGLAAVLRAAGLDAA